MFDSTTATLALARRTIQSNMQGCMVEGIRAGDEASESRFGRTRSDQHTVAAPCVSLALPRACLAKTGRNQIARMRSAFLGKKFCSRQTDGAFWHVKAVLCSDFHKVSSFSCTHS